MTDRYRNWGVPRSADFVVRRRPAVAAVLTLILKAGRATRSGPTVLVLGGWERPSYLLAFAVARGVGVPIVLFYESTGQSHRFEKGPVDKLRRIIFQNCQAVLTVGQASAQAALRMGVEARRVVVGQNAVDVDKFSRRASPRCSELEVSSHNVIYVGQLIARKNVATAISAWATVRGDQDRFLIVGYGAERQNLQAVVDDLGLGAQVDFLGHRSEDEVADLLGVAHTLVLPSTQEVWGLVVNEALAAGCHAVVSETAGVAPSVADMPGVFLSRPDESGIAAALAASRAAWRGPIQNPPILQWTPARFADSALAAARIARQP